MESFLKKHTLMGYLFKCKSKSKCKRNFVSEKAYINAKGYPWLKRIFKVLYHIDYPDSRGEPSINFCVVTHNLAVFAGYGNHRVKRVMFLNTLSRACSCIISDSNNLNLNSTSNAEATFVQSTRSQIFLKAI